MDAPPQKPPEILVVDDDADNLQLITSILIGKGYRVRPASDGAIALRSINAKLPDLILLDINMPEMDGYQVCRRIKANRLSRKIPVIFISGLTDTTRKVEGFNAGGVDYITKPFDNDEVLARVETHLSVHKLQRQMVAQNLKLEQEIKERKQVESMLQQAHADLEARVLDRTRELREINRQLASEIEVRRRSEQENLRRAGELALLNRVIAASVSETKADAILAIACKELARAFEQGQSMAILFDKEEDRADVVAEYMSENQSLPSAIDHRFELGEHTAFSGLLMQNQAVMVTDIDADSRFTTVMDFFRRRRTRAVLMTPVSANGKTVGWIMNEDPEPYSFSQDQVRLAQSVADQVSSVLTRIVIDEERRKLEDQYHQAQKMEAIGKLTGGVAHDFNNILTVIMGVTDLMRLQQARNSPLLHRLNQVHDAASRAADLVGQLLAFSRQQVLQPTTIDLNQVIGNFEKMLRRVIGEDIEMKTCLSQELGLVKADPGQIEQVLMNLAVNARDVMPRGGNLTIETSNFSVDEQYAKRHMGILPGDYILLSITDTGTGMEPQIKKHIFEPFFTTKEKGEGTGLGLSTVHGIVNQSGGHIWVYSEPGMGTSFKIFLPQFEAAVGEFSFFQAAEDTNGGSETILVVEDDDIVRALVTETLTGYGYCVLAADCAKSADRIVAAHSGDIEMLLTDVVIPGGESGAQMAKRLSTALPNLKVLYMSGYTDDAIILHGVEDNGVNFIQKPFMPLELARKVRQILDV